MSIGDNARFGYDAFLGVAEETTFGSTATSASFTYVEFGTESLKRTREELKLESINTSRDFRRRLTMNETVEGAVECDLNVASDAVVYIMKQAMGGTVASEVETAAVSYKHTFYQGDMENNKGTSTADDVKSLTFRVAKGAHDTSTTNMWDFNGCRVNNLSIKGEVGSPVIMTAELVGKTASLCSTVPTVAFSNVAPCTFIGATVEVGDSLDSTTAESFTGFEVSINNNLVSDTNARVLGERTVKILPPTRREIGLKLTQRYDTTTAYQRAIDETSMAIIIKLDSLQTIGAAATTYSMHIKLPTCYFNSNMPEIGDFGVITHELEVSPISSNTSTGYSIQLEMFNATANYE